MLTQLLLVTYTAFFSVADTATATAVPNGLVTDLFLLLRLLISSTLKCQALLDVVTMIVVLTNASSKAIKMTCTKIRTGNLEGLRLLLLVH